MTTEPGASRQAVVLVHLGTPSAATPAGVRTFLRDFLSDRRVVELPRAIWWPLLHGFILPLRPRRVARSYQALWQQWGDSPLRVLAGRQLQRLRQHLARPELRIELAMTYGEPGLAATLDTLQREGIDQVLVLPLYPQYSATTTAAVMDETARFIQRHRALPGLAMVRDYHDHPLYIEGLAQTVEAYWQRQGRGQRLLLSFHGIPERNVERGDPYLQQCQRTADLLARRLELEGDDWTMSFQSRLGRARWLQPYTDQLLQQWGEQGLGRVDVLCPAFAVDCLETLEEIEVENRARFAAAGGGALHYIPCLNDSRQQLDLLQALIDEHLPRGRHSSTGEEK